MREQEAGRDPYENWSAVMETLLHGDLDSQRVAFLKLQRLIAGFLVSLQAWDHRTQWEDLQQTVVMKLVKSWSREQLHVSQAFVAYARTITRHEFYDFLKVRGSSMAVAEEAEQKEEEAREEDTSLAVRAVLSHLPAEQRRALQAVYLEGRTYEEAAAVTGIPLGSLKRYLRLGVGQLWIQLAGILE